MKIGKSLAAIVLASLLGSVVTTSAFAGALAGEYNVTSDCILRVTGHEVVIQKGRVTISENIPVNDPLTASYVAILVQANGISEPLLKLGVGIVQPFQYGLQPFSVGAYNSTGDEFIVHSFAPKPSGGSALLQTLRLFYTAGGVNLMSVDELNDKVVICPFGSKI